MPNIAGVLNEEAAPPKPAYEGYVETVRWSGCAALILEPDGLRIETLFDQEAVAFADIEAVAGDTGSVRLRLKSGDIEISRMGESGAWFRRELLEAAYPYIKAGAFGGIRISTRPDAVSGEILEELKQYGVTAIELGAQSMEDSVLALNERGHSAEDVVRASAMIREAHRRAADSGYRSAVVLGHKDYYPRFGYRKAADFGIAFPFGLPQECCMAVELLPGGLEGVSGTVRYPRPFME